VTATASELALMQGAPPPADRQVTVANWQEGPFNRWGFQHVSEIVPSAVLSRGDGPVLMLERAEEDIGPLVDEFLERTYTDGFLVLRDGRILYERYFNGMTAHTTHLLQSVSKSYCSALAGWIVERGLVELERPVRDYVPELWDGGFGDATVDQLLDMTASVVFSEEYADPRSEVQAQDRAAGWRPRRPHDPESSYAFLRGLRKAAAHGRVFQYCSATTDVLAWVLERASGKRYTELLATELWPRVGAEHDASITVDSTGFGFANGGMAVTLRDLGRFGHLMLNGGGVDGFRVTPAGWGTRHLSAGPALMDGDFRAAYPGGFYRAKWWCTGDELGTFYGVGIYGQYVWIVPRAGLVIAKLSSLPKALDPAVTRDHHLAFRRLADSLA
jgi:6-aminohexanoate-oligomer exohydrolase